MLNVIATKCINGSVQISKPNGDKWILFDKYDSYKPDYRFKFIMLNCYKYKIIWVK